MPESDNEGSQVLSQLRDLRDVPLSSVCAQYVDEVSAVVCRMVDDTSMSSKPPVAAFQSLI